MVYSVQYIILRLQVFQMLTMGMAMKCFTKNGQEWE